MTMCSSFQAARLEHTAEFGAFSATFIVVENLTKGWTPHQILPYGSMPRTLCSGFNPEPACAWALHQATKSLNTVAMILTNFLKDPNSERNRKVNTSGARFLGARSPRLLEPSFVPKLWGIYEN